MTDRTEASAHPFDALATIGCVYLALVTGSFAAFRFLAVLPAGAKRNPDLTFFQSANLVSLSGFEQTNAAVANYPLFGLILVALVVLLSALTSLIAGGYFLARVFRVRISLAKVSVLAAILLALPLLTSFLVGGFNSISAATGLGLFGRPSVTVPAAMIAIGVGMLGTVGVLPMRQLVTKSDQSDPRRYIGWMWIALVVLIVGGAIALAACGTPWNESFYRSLALRSFGGDAGPRLNASPAMPWVMMVLSTLGAFPGSTAGGLSLLPIVILARGANDALRGRAVDPLLGVAIGWIATFGIAIVGFVIALSTVASAVPPDRALLLVCSALGNVGVSHEPVGIVGAGTYVLSIAMLAGRLLPLVMLAWMACVVERRPTTGT